MAMPRAPGFIAPPPTHKQQQLKQNTPHEITHRMEYAFHEHICTQTYRTSITT